MRETRSGMAPFSVSAGAAGARRRRILLALFAFLKLLRALRLDAAHLGEFLGARGRLSLRLPAGVRRVRQEEPEVRGRGRSGRGVRRRRRRGGSRHDGVFAQTNLRRRRARRAKHGGEGHQRGFPRAGHARVHRAVRVGDAVEHRPGLTGVRRGGSGTPRRRRADRPNTSASPSGSGSDRPAWRPADASAGSSARSCASPRAPAAAATGPARPDGRGRARHAGAPRRGGRARAAATTHRLTALFRSAGTAATGAATTHAAANISTRCLGTPNQPLERSRACPIASPRLSDARPRPLADPAWRARDDCFASNNPTLVL